MDSVLEVFRMGLQVHQRYLSKAAQCAFTDLIFIWRQWRVLPSHYLTTEELIVTHRHVQKVSSEAQLRVLQ